VEYFPATKTLILLVNDGEFLSELAGHITSVLQEYYISTFDDMEHYVPCRHCFSSFFLSVRDQPICDLDLLVDIAQRKSITTPICIKFKSGPRTPKICFFQKSPNSALDDDPTLGRFHLFEATEIQRTIFNDAKPSILCPLESLQVRASYLAPDLVLRDVPRISDLRFGRELGRGGEAIVYHGTIPSSQTRDGDGGDEEVAVKVLEGVDLKDEMNSFFHEVAILRLLKHPNLVQMLGLCFREERDQLLKLTKKIGIVVELVKGSDLQKLLETKMQGRLNQDVFHPSLPEVKVGEKGESCAIFDPEEDPEGDGGELTFQIDLASGASARVPESLVSITHRPLGDSEISWEFRVRVMLDVAHAMQYLHSLAPPIIHRDLRSPNVFLMSQDCEAPVVAKVFFSFPFF
jgi:Protein tyrosine and serine/threonine kinase